MVDWWEFFWVFSFEIEILWDAFEDIHCNVVNDDGNDAKNRDLPFAIVPSGNLS